MHSSKQGSNVTPVGPRLRRWRTRTSRLPLHPVGLAEGGCVSTIRPVGPEIEENLSLRYLAGAITRWASWPSTSWWPSLGWRARDCLALAQDWYTAPLERVGFTTEPAAARAHINTWVADRRAHRGAAADRCAHARHRLLLLDQRRRLPGRLDPPVRRAGHPGRRRTHGVVPTVHQTDTFAYTATSRWENIGLADRAETTSRWSDRPTH